jgi:hypothetical protein
MKWMSSLCHLLYYVKCCLPTHIRRDGGLKTCTLYTGCPITHGIGLHFAVFCGDYTSAPIARTAKVQDVQTKSDYIRHLENEKSFP